MPPVVQSLDQILAELDPAYAPQRQLFQQQQTLLPGQQATAKQGLEVGKQNAFRDVNTNANSKGLAFSGIPAAEQTRYLGEKFLPAVANMESDFQKQGFTLAQAIASLEGEKRLKGLDTRSGQEKVLQAYQEAERDRQFKAQQQREQIAAENVRAARASAAKPDTRLRDTIDTISGGLANRAGGDSRVNPEDWGKAKRQWVGMGFAPGEFDAQFGQFVNGRHYQDYWLN